MISLEQALAAYEAIEPTPCETVSLSAALGRTLAADVQSPVDLPLGDQSAMDGYAVCAHDTRSATAEQPLHLSLESPIATGSPPGRLTPGCHARRIGTGGWIPDGADAVVIQERVTANDQEIVVSHPVEAGAHIRCRGETLAIGDPLLAAGDRITPSVIGLLAQCGIDTVTAHRPPQVAVIVTGSELRPPGSPLRAGQAYESNGAMLAAHLAVGGADCRHVTRCADDPAEIATALAAAAEWADLVLTSGGVSVGDADHVREACRRSGFATDFRKVAQKPGKPLLLAHHGRTWLLGLPGNPASADVCARVHLRAVLQRLSGRSARLPWQIAATDSLPPADRTRTRLLRVQADISAAGKLTLQALPHLESHELRGAAEQHGLLRIPPVSAPESADSEPVWLEDQFGT